MPPEAGSVSTTVVFMKKCPHKDSCVRGGEGAAGMDVCPMLWFTSFCPRFFVIRAFFRFLAIRPPTGLRLLQGLPTFIFMCMHLCACVCVTVTQPWFWSCPVFYLFAPSSSPAGIHVVIPDCLLLPLHLSFCSSSLFGLSRQSLVFLHLYHALKYCWVC